jgi:glycosyltransferase involved in cell wall biosynthesis
VAEIGADRFLTEAGISLVHSHMISLEIFFFEQCRIQTKVPYVVTLHGSYEAQTVSRSTLQNIAARVSHWVYTAEKNLVPFRDLDVPAGRFTKIGNAAPIDSRSFPKTRGELGIAPDAIVFTLVARGIKTKGWRAAVGAFKRLREEQPGRKMHLLLAGEGEEADRQALLHKNDPNITFLGYQARIAGLYRISDCAIVPTRFVGESFPFCVIEALQAGTPVVATRIGEIPSMIAPTGLPAGILIENQRDTDLFIDELKGALAAFLDASTRARFAANAARLGRNYRMEDVASHYLALYERILQEGSRGDVLRKFAPVAGGVGIEKR